eukprot:GHRQ01037154.1.p1 GENE.GHRQ01037154.1~~GHRQ01037154.1.p1  ORF type:complete len:106 (+),score=14.10 GHRQ01037154.1:286-603(+)
MVAVDAQLLLCKQYWQVSPQQLAGTCSPTSMSRSRTSSMLAAVSVALCSSSASFSSSLTAVPSAAYRRFRLSFMRALASMICAAACRNFTRSVSVLMSSDMLHSG